MRRYIYVLYNRENGKRYVGQTRNPIKREKQHFSEGKKGRLRHPLYDSMLSHGVDKFDFFIIQECSAEEVDDVEIAWIVALRTREREFGYNLRPGGSKMPDVTYEKISQAMSGRHFTDEHKAKLRAANIGRQWQLNAEQAERRRKNCKERPSFLGKKHAKETRSKIGQANSSLTWEIVDQLRFDFSTGLTRNQLVEKYQLSYSAVKNIIANRRWIRTIL